VGSEMCIRDSSSTGVGQKIDLEYNIETMRITDPGIDNSDGAGGPPKAFSIMNQIRNKPADPSGEGPAEFKRATGTPAWEQGPKVTGEADSTKLKKMIAGIKKGDD
jgi:hypothetical protein